MDKKLQEKKYYLDQADNIVSQLSSETVEESTVIKLVSTKECLVCVYLYNSNVKISR